MDYRHLIGPEDRYDPDDEGSIIDPPTLEVVSRFWQSARTGSAAFKAFAVGSPTAGEDRVLLAYSIDERGQNFLHMAAEVGDPQTIRLFRLEFADRHGRRPQHVADLEERLPRQRDLDGNMPLHIAAANDNLDFAKAILRYHVQGRGGDPVLSILPTRRQYISRPEIRYLLPLLDRTNKAGRTAAQEAWHRGAKTTGRWLDEYRFHLLGEDHLEEGVDEDDDGGGSRALLRHSSNSREMLQVICASGAMVVAMLPFDLARS